MHQSQGQKKSNQGTGFWLFQLLPLFEFELLLLHLFGAHSLFHFQTSPDKLHQKVKSVKVLLKWDQRSSVAVSVPNGAKREDSASTAQAFLDLLVSVAS